MNTLTRDKNNHNKLVKLEIKVITIIRHSNLNYALTKQKPCTTAIIT